MATILIVDDEEPLRQLVSQVLRDGGHRTLQAIHGAQALEMIARDRPDLVLCDVMMPVLSGAELCRQIKANADTRSIPVILMSSAGGQSAHGAGGDAYLDKPFHLKDLEDVVRRWLAR